MNWFKSKKPTTVVEPKKEVILQIPPAAELKAKIEEARTKRLVEIRNAIAIQFGYGGHPWSNMTLSFYLSSGYANTCTNYYLSHQNSDIDFMIPELEALGYQVVVIPKEDNKPEHREVRIKDFTI